MGILDKRVPAVYVEIEDKSYVGPTLDLPRPAYTVIISDRGPANMVTEITSWNEFLTLFGPPNIDKTGQAHYLCYQHLKYSNKLYVTRVCTEDATYANATIKYNHPAGSSQKIFGNFTFTNGSNVVECSDPESMDNIGIGDKIYHPADSPDFSLKVIDKITNNQTNTYQMILESEYQGSSGTVEYLYIFYDGTILINGNFNFNNGSNLVTVDNYTLLEGIEVGDWIYSDSDDHSKARQIIDINYYEGELILDDGYAGTTIIGPARIYRPFTMVYLKNINSPDEFDPADTDNVFTFYSYGPGSWYNSLFIKGVRNVDYETLYIDDLGNPLYKYAFMDLYIYEVQSDYSLKLIDGPYLVSFIRTTKEGDVVRNIVTGEELYIETVINSKSRIIQCKSALGADVLLNSDDAELKRLQIMTMFSEGRILKLNTLGREGFRLRNGSDGSQYNSQGRLDLSSNVILRGKVIQAFNGTLRSKDGSVENITQSIYPWFTFSYVYSGGYDAIVQNAARELVDIREDCLLLADTGRFETTPNGDERNRIIDVPWNTPHAMIYTQYRTFDDPFTGKRFYITPVYDAIECHLLTDANYWLSEPVAGIEKGALRRPAVLAYRPNLTKTGDLIDRELNPTIIEPEGVYIISQLTTYKRLSILKRAHVVKFIHYLRHTIPTILKDILQRKATMFWVTEARTRVENFMRKFLDQGDFSKYASIKSFTVDVEFDDVTSELIVLIKMTPIRAIERIIVRIVVY
ncbi:MAG: hypothetical protein QXD03_01765 [Candidatus Anstonellales archaeon]